jgi:hypothetical protein
MLRRMKGIILVLAIAACGKGGGGGSSGGGEAAAPIDVAPINKLVPDAWKAKVEFTAQTVGEKKETFEVAAPKDWKKGFVPGSLEPGETAGDAFGFGARMDVGTNCDGDCVAKDWAATADKVEFKQFEPGGQSSAKVVKEEKGAGRRTLIAASDDKTYIVTAWWKEGETHYNACHVTIGNGAKDLVPAFAAACATARAK